VDPHSRSSLDSPTKLDRARVAPRGRARWLLTLYPDACEAGGCLQSAGGSSGGDSWWEPEPGRSAFEAARRARGQVRRYCAANRLNRLGDVTYAGAGCFDPLQLRADVAEFFKRLRCAVGIPFPYLWVTEWHKSHGLHAHLAVNRFIPWGADRGSVGARARLDSLPRGPTGRVRRAGRGEGQRAVPGEVHRQGLRAWLGHWASPLRGSGRLPAPSCAACGRERNRSRRACVGAYGL
jgi:hypothetical protein